MNALEMRELLLTLKACGATHFKSHDMEITMSAGLAAPVVTPPPVSMPPQFYEEAPVPSPAMNEDATEKLQGLIKTLQLSPEQLLDVVMPAGASS